MASDEVREATLGFGTIVLTDAFINDYDTVERTWRERLFTRPWRPWVSTKRVYAPKFYKLPGGRVLMSPASEASLREKLGVRGG